MRDEKKRERGIGSMVATAIDVSVKGGAAVGLMGLFLMVLIITYEVIMRYCFNSPTRWVTESSCFLLLITTFFLAAHTLKHKKHVRSDLISARLPQEWQKRVDILTYVCGIIYCAILTWTGVLFLSHLYQHQVRSDDMWVLVWPIMACFVIGSLLFTLQFIVDFLYLINKDHLPKI